MINRKYKYLILGAAFLIGFVAYEAISQQKKSINQLYEYNVHADYKYSFDEKKVAVYKSPIYGNRFQLPQTNTAWDTGFLKIRIESDWIGRLKEPFMEIASGDVTQRQYFERGASGVRYLNLSNFSTIRGGSGIVISLIGHHVDLRDQEADLYLFRNDPIGNDNVLIVAPHPDDAEIAAFGLYSQSRASIVTITAGDAGAYILQKRKSTDKERNSIIKGKLRV